MANGNPNAPRHTQHRTNGDAHHNGHLPEPKEPAAREPRVLSAERRGGSNGHSRSDDFNSHVALAEMYADRENDSSSISPEAQTLRSRLKALPWQEGEGGYWAAQLSSDARKAELLHKQVQAVGKEIGLEPDPKGSHVRSSGKKDHQVRLSREEFLNSGLHEHFGNEEWRRRTAKENELAEGNGEAVAVNSR